MTEKSVLDPICHYINKMPSVLDLLTIGLAFPQILKECCW